MNKIAIVTDTNSGIPSAEARERGIYQVPMPVNIDSDTYFENETITYEDFFKRLEQGATVSSSQPAPAALTELWDRLLKEHDELIYIPMSSALSGSFQTAQMLAQDYAGKVFVVDNRRVSIPQRQSALEAKFLADHGKTAQEIANYLNEDALAASAYVAVNTLEYLKKSGRVTAAGAAIAMALNIKPVLQIQGGKLDAYKKGHGMRHAIQIMINALKQDREKRFSGEKVTIRAAYAGDAEAGALWQTELSKAFPDLYIGLDTLPISISSHTGAGAIGACIMRDILTEN